MFIPVRMLLEVIIRGICIVLGIPTFLCAGTAVSHLNLNAIHLRHVEYSRDSTVSAAGIVVFLGLLTMLMELVIVFLRLVNKGAVNTCVDISISVIFALLYFCLGIFIAVFADDWKHQKISSAETLTIHNSLAAASVLCFIDVCMFIVLAVLMLWNEILDPDQALDTSSSIYSHLKSQILETLMCYPMISSQDFVEFSIRSACFVMGIPTIVCAAIAVNHLNGDAIILRDVEQSRDNTVTAAGMVVGVALVSMLIEGVITVMRLCRRSCVIATVDMIFSTVVALVYFCLAIPMALFSTEWSNEQNPSGNSLGSGDFPDEVYTISTSLAAASVFGFLSMSFFAVLAVKMCVFLAFERDTFEQNTFEQNRRLGYVN